MKRKSKLGLLLLKEGLINEEQLKRALDIQEETGRKLGSILVGLGFITQSELMNFLSNQYHVPFIDLRSILIDGEVVNLLPKDLVYRHQVFPVKKIGKVLTLAMSNPDDVDAIEEVKFATGCQVNPVIAPAEEIKSAIEEYYEEIGTDLQTIDEEEIDIGDDLLGDEFLGEFDESDLETMQYEQEVDIGRLNQNSKPIVNYVNFIIADAVRKGASDIHIEMYEKLFRVRYRIDGVLREVLKPDITKRFAIVARIKTMANLDITERRRPQDGRIRVNVDKNPIDIRVSIIPVINGEKVVMRILDQSSLMLDMRDLGFEEDNLKKFNNAIEKPYGIVLVTGPTGSGKSTTLYSAMSRLNTPDVQILTAEDPVEYNLFGINQVQVNPSIGFTFAEALRAFLRQGPDIVMVGEIRDSETAQIAIRAALTGHLVLSTIHTNDAPSTINRLIDMGIEPFLLSASLNLIQAQRLVRRICPNCKTEVMPDENLLREAHIDPAIFEGKPVYKGAGCPVCGGTGYKGRVAITEVLDVTSHIRELIIKNASTEEIRNAARKDGFRTLQEDGLLKIKKGLTTIEEIIRETGIEE